MTNGNPNHHIDKEIYNQKAIEVYKKSDSIMIVMAILSLLIFVILAQFLNGTVIFWLFVFFYIGAITFSVIIQNKLVEEVGGGLQGFKWHYWKYAIRTRLRFLGLLGRIIFGVLFKFVLPAIDAGIKDANRGWDD